MTVIATDSQRFSNVVKHEYAPETAYCRDVITAYEAAAKTYIPGTVLGKTLTSGAGTATANAGNTGTGTVGTITVNGKAEVGTYNVIIEQAVTDKGLFTVFYPNGRSAGSGQVGSVFSGSGLSFTISDATDFVVGDGFGIAVTGTVKYKIAVATATDGSAVPAAIAIADQFGNSGNMAVAITTNTTILALTRGPAIVADLALGLDASFSTTALKNSAYAALEAIGIRVAAQV